MNELPWVRGATFAAVLGSGAMAGVFFTFAAFVMPALERLPPAQGITAMQSINLTAVRPPLMALLFGTAVLCLPLAVLAVRQRNVPLLAGALVYLVSVVGVTAGGNVPLNDALAVLDPHGPGAAQSWADFLAGWGRWNAVRMVGSAAAAAAFLVALVRR